MNAKIVVRPNHQYVTLYLYLLNATTKNVSRKPFRKSPKVAFRVSNLAPTSSRTAEQNFRAPLAAKCTPNWSFFAQSGNADLIVILLVIIYCALPNATAHCILYEVLNWMESRRKIDLYVRIGLKLLLRIEQQNNETKFCLHPLNRVVICYLLRSGTFRFLGFGFRLFNVCLPFNFGEKWILHGRFWQKSPPTRRFCNILMGMARNFLWRKCFNKIAAVSANLGISDLPCCGRSL